MVVKTDNTAGPVIENFHADFGGALGSEVSAEAHLEYAREGSEERLGGRPEPFRTRRSSRRHPSLSATASCRRPASRIGSTDPGIGPIWCCVYISRISGKRTDRVGAQAAVRVTAGPSKIGGAAASLGGGADQIGWDPFFLVARKRAQGRRDSRSGTRRLSAYPYGSGFHRWP